MGKQAKEMLLRGGGSLFSLLGFPCRSPLGTRTDSSYLTSFLRMLGIDVKVDVSSLSFWELMAAAIVILWGSTSLSDACPLFSHHVDMAPNGSRRGGVGCSDLTFCSA